jgi:transposase-like protein
VNFCPQEVLEKFLALRGPDCQQHAAREWLERRVWPNGPVCPHCGATSDDVKRLEGKKHRPGLFQCSQCREQFTVTVKTVFERSKIPLSKWLAALFMMTASNEGVSAHQIHRSLGISYKTAWFLCHRLREAMRQGGLAPLGGSGKTVETDETYFGTIPKAKIMPRAPGKKPGGRKAGIRRPAHRAVLALAERVSKARTFHIAQVDQNTVSKLMREKIDRETRINMDESKIYNIVPWQFAKHETVKHKDDEYVRGDVTTNGVEGYFSVFKRGMKGIYQHCGEKHLHRYLAEFDFRFNTRTALDYNDLMHAEELAGAIEGKRLTYRRPWKITQSYEAKRFLAWRKKRGL